MIAKEQLESWHEQIQILINSRVEEELQMRFHWFAIALQRLGGSIEISKADIRELDPITRIIRIDDHENGKVIFKVVTNDDI